MKHLFERFVDFAPGLAGIIMVFVISITLALWMQWLGL